MKRFSTFLMLLAMAVSVSAHDFEVDGIYYLINGSEATVTYKGSDPNEYVCSDMVIIPDKVTYNDTTYKVTSIGDSAFYQCNELHEIILLDSLKQIGDAAFYNCSNLTILIIPNGVKTIGQEAFCKCTGIITVILGSGLESIGDRAFWGCTRLTYIECRSVQPPICGAETFGNIDPNACRIGVPAEAGVAYRTTYPWKRFFGEGGEEIDIEDIVNHSSVVIKGTADIRKYSSGEVPSFPCLMANRINDRLSIWGVVPKCDLEKSKIHYTITDEVIIVDIELVPDKKNGCDAIQADFGPCTADSYQLYVRYNDYESIDFGVNYCYKPICCDGYSSFNLESATFVCNLSVLTPEPKAGQPVTIQLDVDWYGGVDSLFINSFDINHDMILLHYSCCFDSGTSTHATATITIDSIPYPDYFTVYTVITYNNWDDPCVSSPPETVLKVTADEGWNDPRTLKYFLRNASFPNIIENEPFQFRFIWEKLVLPDTPNKTPVMQVDSVIDRKVFVSVHYDTTVEMPYGYNYPLTTVTIPGLKAGVNTIVLTGVDEAGRYNYASYEIEIYVDYITYQGTFGISDDDCRYVDEEGRNDLTFDFVGDSLHVQGLLWMQCNNPKEVYYQINGELIQCRVKLKNSRDMSAARYHVDFYLSPCPLDEYSIMVEGRGQNRAAVCDTFYVARQPDSSIWVDGSQWDVVYYDSESDNGSDVEVERVTYSLRQAEDGCLALAKTVSVDGVTSDAEVQGYIRNDHDTLIYVRPVLADGTIGEECLLYDFRKPFEYGGTVRYGVLGGEVVEERIDWNAGTLDYFMLKGGDKHCLPAWKDIIYGYGCLGGPMELFMQSAAPQKKGQPKPTNISHVIFTTKGGQKTIHMRGEEDEQEIEIPYDEMLQTGTVWECLEVSAEEPDCMHTYTIQVQGDVMIAGRLCKQVYSSEKGTQLTLFEEGRKVYIVNADETPEVLFDFGLQRGDILADESCVIYTDMIQNQGYDYRRIGIDTNLDCCAAFADDTTPWSYDLIEGIGVSKDEHLPGQRPFSEERTISYLLRCWRGNTLVYQSSAYDYLTGINALRLNTETPLYDLQGRPTSHPAPGIYIQNGHKVVKR